jgi:integrase
MPRQRFQDPKIQQSKNGSFFIRPWVDIVTPAGLDRRKKTIVLGPVTIGKRAAITKKNEVMKTINNADYVIKAQIKLKDFVVKYRENHLNNLSHAQQCKFDWAMKNHIGPMFNEFTLSEITTLALQEWLNAKQKAGMKKSSRLGLRNIISGLFERAITWKIYQEANPIVGVKIFGENDAREKRKLSDEQIREFLAELPYDVRLLCSVCLFCTLRISEGFALQEKHLDFTRSLILVRQSYYRGVLRPEPKSSKGKRDMPMGYLADDLNRICVGDPENFVFRIRTHPKWGREVHLCRDDRDLNQHFLRPAAKKLGFYYQGFGFRALRREAITEIGSVAGIGQAMDAAGHSTMDMSLLYTVQDKTKQEKAIRAFQERILGKVDGPVQ